MFISIISEIKIKTYKKIFNTIFKTFYMGSSKNYIKCVVCIINNCEKINIINFITIKILHSKMFDKPFILIFFTLIGYSRKITAKEAFIRRFFYIKPFKHFFLHSKASCENIY
ncbi:hypothetical protein PBI_SCTP2_134 [Salicola phage SCTP-2]|nr:hypothetical protein PBI_SCTP2_134 [Salicola phage SCTP-2]